LENLVFESNIDLDFIGLDKRIDLDIEVNP
jgi:hypothetical protein